MKTRDNDVYSYLRLLSRRDDGITKDLIVAKQRNHKALQLSFPELETMFSSTSNKLFLNIVELFPHPFYVLQCSRTILKNKILQGTKKNLSQQRAPSKSIHLLRIAEDSYPAINHDHPVCDDVIYYGGRIKELENERKKLLKRMV